MALIYFATRDAVALSKQLDKAQLGRKIVNLDSISLYETDPMIPHVVELLPYLASPVPGDTEGKFGL